SPRSHPPPSTGSRPRQATGQGRSTCATWSPCARRNRWSRRWWRRASSAGTIPWAKPRMDEILSIPDAGFGILSPAQGAASPAALVLLNAGLTHRVGPFRCYVQFARRLASRGTHVFRFDLPRVGDGRPGGPGTEAI